MPPPLKRSGILLLLFLPLLLSSACLPSKKLTISATATLLQDVARSSYKQSDLRITREGMPAYLMLMDGMIEAWPDNEQLLIAAAQTFSSFASILVEDRDRGYIKLLSEKGRKYALRALEIRGLKKPLQSTFEEFRGGIQDLKKSDVPYLFWGATCWANWIMLNLDSMEALAELPKVEWMMERVLEIDETFYYGGAHLFMGIWFSSRPRTFGGNLQKAQGHFLKAFEFGKGNFLMAYIYYADYYARQALDKNLFISTLQKVLDTPADISPELTLINTVAKEKAKALLTDVEDYFE